MIFSKFYGVNTYARYELFFEPLIKRPIIKPPAMTFRERQKLLKAATQAASKFAGHPDIEDIFLGTKYVDGKPTEDISIRFNVQKKKAKSALKPSRVLPKKLDGFKTDVTDFKSENHTRIENAFMEVRPVFGGLQIQSSRFNGPLEWGTIGCAFRINSRWYGITNAHVSFGEMQPDEIPPGNLQMIQPKVRNFGEPIGNITSVFNLSLDYSLFTINEPIDSNQSINGFDGVIEGFTNPDAQMNLFKFGAATGLTCGKLDAQSVLNQHRIIIRFDPNGPNDSNRISLPGDSGAMWVTHKNASPGNLRMVALHYGGNEQHNLAYASLFSFISRHIRTKIPQA